MRLWERLNMGIVHCQAALSKSAPPRIKCRTCFTGLVRVNGESCAQCWAHHQHTQHFQARSRRCELMNRLSAVVGCTSEELIELLGGIVVGIVTEFTQRKEGAA